MFCSIHQNVLKLTINTTVVYLQPPPEYLGDSEQYQQLHIPKRLDDAHSDMSGDSAGDSGKGGSDDDLHSPNSIGHDGKARIFLFVDLRTLLL